MCEGGRGGSGPIADILATNSAWQMWPDVAAGRLMWDFWNGAADGDWAAGG